MWPDKCIFLKSKLDLSIANVPTDKNVGTACFN